MVMYFSFDLMFKGNIPYKEVIFMTKMASRNISIDLEAPVYNAVTLAALAELQDMKRNPQQYKSFDSVEALFEDLNDDD